MPISLSKQRKYIRRKLPSLEDQLRTIMKTMAYMPAQVLGRMSKNLTNIFHFMVLVLTFKTVRPRTELKSLLYPLEQC